MKLYYIALWTLGIIIILLSICLIILFLEISIISFPAIISDLLLFLAIPGMLISFPILHFFICPTFPTLELCQPILYPQEYYGSSTAPIESIFIFSFSLIFYIIIFCILKFKFRKNKKQKFNQ